jgi:hypothetical protein
MGKMEWRLLDSRKKEHEAVTAVSSELGRLGYLINGIGFKNGALEIICCPPDKEDGAEKKPREALKAGYGIDEFSSGLSMDGVSETFNAETRTAQTSFKGIQKIIELAGYRVISIGAEHSDLRFTGVINLQIAPAEWLDQTDFVRFPQPSRDFLENCREYAAQSRQQGNGTGQE